MRVIVVRHHAEDSAGFIADAFLARGAELSVHLFPDDGPLPPVEGADHLVMLGAISAVYDPDVSWIEPELRWLRAADEAGVPVLGICYGAQELCTIFGGRVASAGRKEIGWHMIDSVEPDLIPAGPWLEFHGDRCEPPAHATILASNEFGVQAFSVGRHLGVQFHPEVDGAQLRLWLEAGGRRDVIEAGLDPGQFLDRTIAEEPGARARADRLVDTALRLARSPSATVAAAAAAAGRR
jgi:GMP synthase-like glutamine amidotransferase